MTKPAKHSANWCSAFCNANGIDIHYLRTGRGRPPLVALHGLIGSGACLSPLARALEGKFDVLLPDARGHGQTSAPPRGYLYPDFAADVVGLIGVLRLRAPILVGHSMGGMTAAVVAAHTDASLSALVLLDPTFIGPDWQREVYESDVAAEHKRLRASTRDDLLIQARTRSPDRSDELLGFLTDARLQTSLSAFEVLTPPNPDFRELIRNINVPTLLIIGESGIVSAEVARELQEINPLLRCALIPDAGHGLPYDAPIPVAAAILSFLREVIDMD